MSDHQSDLPASLEVETHAHRVADLMLTGRVLTADEGHAFGLSHYLTDTGQGFAKAMELAQSICTNSPVTNYAVIHVLPRIAEVNPVEGYVMESLMAAISQGTDEAKDRMRAFVEGKAARLNIAGEDAEQPGAPSD